MTTAIKLDMWYKARRMAADFALGAALLLVPKNSPEAEIIRNGIGEIFYLLRFEKVRRECCGIKS